MKYRECKIPADIDISPDSIPERDTKKWQTETYKLKVITPIYGGGVKAGEPDTEMPIRASEIRGQLRYWWRFLYINDPENKEAKEENKKKFYKGLFEKERDIWGGMADAKELKEALKKGKDFSSKVFIRVSNIKKFNKDTSIKRCGEYIGRRMSFNHEIPPYSLFPGQGKPPLRNGEDPQEQPHDVIVLPIEFSLSLTMQELNNKEKKAIKETVNWWINFGGIGARTRRGLGSLECINSICDKLALGKKDVEKYGCKLEKINATSAMDAWSKAVGRLHDFRQGYRDGPYGRSKWPEPDSIRFIVGNQTEGHEPRVEELPIPSFPRAAFGLPILFDFVNDAPPEKTVLYPILSNGADKKDSRMASPLILKAIKVDGLFKAVALKMPDAHLKDLTIELNNSGNANNNYLPKPFADGSWWDSSKAVQVDPINDYKGENNATDALTAFMNFFAEGGEK